SVGEAHYPAFGELLSSVRTGRPAFDKVFGMPLFDYFAANPAAARDFDEALAELRSHSTAALLEVCDFSDVQTLVDVGGGTGSLLCAALAKYPGLRGVLFDRPDVIPRAEAVLRAAGVRDRCDLVGGDFFEAVPAGGDVYVLRHILHDWEDARAVRVLRN